MVGTYEIKQGTGSVAVTREGLYYRFSCRCKLSGEVMHRLMVRTDAGQVDLGVCVPMDGCFGADKKVPCKKFGSHPEFFLMPKHEGVKGRFVPVYPEEPFVYISKLKKAFLEVRYGQVGIVINET